MRIIIDTNVVISGSFFGGVPRKILEATVGKLFDVCANPEIVNEYNITLQDMIDSKKGHVNFRVLRAFMREVHIVPAISSVSVCRDPDDDKFINCAIDAKAIYIVSGDKDLLTIREYNDIQILTAREFFDLYLQNERTTPETESEAEDDGTE